MYTGSGSSSVFVAVDILLEQARCENCVSVERVCSELRRQWSTAVPTIAHYVFVYECLHELLCINYAWLGADMRRTFRLMSRPALSGGQTSFADQFDLLRRQTADHVVEASPSSGHLLTLDSHRFRNCFIVAERPRGASDRLWRTVYTNRARCVVTFADDDNEDEGSVDWKGDSGSFNLEMTEAEDGKGAVRWYTFKMTKTGSREHHSALIVRHFIFTGFSANDTVPACRRDEFIRLIRSNQWRRLRG